MNLALQMGFGFKIESCETNILFDFHKLLQGPPGSDNRFGFLPDHLNPDAVFDGCVTYMR